MHIYDFNSTKDLVAIEAMDSSFFEMLYMLEFATCSIDLLQICFLMRTNVRFSLWFWFCSGCIAPIFVAGSFVAIVLENLAVGVNDLPVARLFKRKEGLVLFLFASNLLENIHHSIKEGCMHLEAKVIILVQSTTALRETKFRKIKELANFVDVVVGKICNPKPKQQNAQKSNIHKTHLGFNKPHIEVLVENKIGTIKLKTILCSHVWIIALVVGKSKGFILHDFNHFP